MLIRFTISSLCIMTICNFSYFPLWFLGGEFGSDCNSSLSMLSFYFVFSVTAVSMSFPFHTRSENVRVFRGSF